MLVRLDKLFSLIREQGIQINDGITSIEQTVANGVENHQFLREYNSEMETLNNQRNCLKSSASVVSSALTVIQRHAGGTSTAAHDSDLGDVFPLEPNETTISWVEYHQRLCSDNGHNVFQQSFTISSESSVQPSLDIGYLDDGDIDLDLATEFYNMAISKRSVGPDGEAEMYFATSS